MDLADVNDGTDFRYCRGCGYALRGLPEARCPECGKVFDPRDPRTVATSPRPSLRSRVRTSLLGRTVVVLAALVVLLTLVEFSVDHGRRYETCRQCGAHSHVQHFTIWGLGGDYGRETTLGPVSRFIQAESGSRCEHQWKAFDLYGGGLFRRWAGTGRGLSRGVSVGRLENSCPSLAAFLQARLEADPDFLRELKTHVLFDDDDASEQYFEQLQLEAEAWLEDHPD